jgi:transposase
MDSHTRSAFGRLEIVETGRRRRWSEDEKRRIVLESLSGPRQVSATARRHNISRSLLLTWRRAMTAESAAPPGGFVPAVVMPDAGALAVAVAPPEPSRPPRLEIVLRCGRGIIVEGAVDTHALIELARGLEALR